MRIIFHTNQLCFRGTSTALYDYAYYARELQGHDVLVMANQSNTLEALPKFEKQFEVVLYQNKSEITDLAHKHGADVFYKITDGQEDGITAAGCRNIIHAVFLSRQPHGDRYAYVSEWLAGAAKWPYFVPHIVPKMPKLGDLREELGIPEDATVFGRHGGLDSFDLQFVKNTIVSVAQSNPNVYFLFMNTNKFVQGLKNVIFLKGTSSLVLKSKFIHSCDAMLHARERGETFGLAIADFSSANKPVLTWEGSRERAHIEVLGNTGFYYKNQADLEEMLHFFKVSKTRNWDCYTEKFSPENVMKQFQEVFLD